MEQIIETQYGQVTGLSKDGCTRYLGIPFAKPPTGHLKFRHPEKPEPWEGVLKAVAGSQNPLQETGRFATPNTSMDCLYLNIFVPDHLPEKAPVMVWIYGGAYTTGGIGAREKGSSEVEYDLSLFAKETKTIAVTVNYRLNVYGFLYLKFLSDEFDTNNGLYDQIMGLRFVRNNIAAFGGDENNITVFGQSAGAASVLALMCMKEAEGLFHKAIIQSSCTEHFFPKSEAVNDTLKYLKIAGVDPGHPEKLLELSAEKINAANAKYGRGRILKGDIRCAFSPIIDGITLKDEPKKAVTQSTMPMLIGNNEHELAMFRPAKLLDTVMPAAGMLVPFDVPKGKESYTLRFQDAMANHIYKRPLEEIIASYKGPAWRYEYRFVSKQMKEAGLGCHHGSEIGPLFYNRTAKQNEDDPETLEAGAKLRKVWSLFAYDGNPGWETWQSSHETHILP